MRIGFIVPCHNEARVIGRRLCNLALERWPQTDVAHELLVVDDHSSDGTAEVAQRVLTQQFQDLPVRARLLTHLDHSGKAAALRAGIEALGHIDLVFISDADVVQRPGSLQAMLAAFVARPQLVLCCAAQEFVESLSADGRCLDDRGQTPKPRPGLYDRITAAVRRLESRCGALVSVHGQLMAFRQTARLQPRLGMAADDLDLMAQARRLGQTALIDAARFLEIKIPAGPIKREQELRRAQAYVQWAQALAQPLGPGPVGRLQHLAYRHLPLAMPWLWPLLCILSAALIAVWGEILWALVWLGSLLVLHRTPLGQRWWRLLRTIQAAKREQRRSDLQDRWQTARE